MAESTGDVVDDGKQCSGRRSATTKAVLMVGEWECFMERREKKAFQYLDRRAEECDWTIGNTLIRRLIRLQNRDD